MVTSSNTLRDRSNTQMTICAEVLTVGDELLRGEVVDTNAAWLATRLWRMGLSLDRVVSVGDALEPLAEQIKRAAARCQVLVISGGLGPTEDDRTTEALGLELELNEEVLAQLRQRFAAAGRPLTPNNEKQAWIPAGATLLPNERGTAPGYMVQLGQCRVACLPGVPSELEAMFDQALAPLLLEQLSPRPAVVRQLHTFGIGESQIDHRLRDGLDAVDRQGCEVSVHYRTSFPCNTVILVVRPGGDGDADQQLAQQVLARLEQVAQERIGRQIHAVDQATFSDAVVAALRAAGATVALAESCTGGLTGDLITQAAGSSEVFSMGLVTYSNEAKHQLLGVPSELLECHGAVSQQCVEAMARGVRERAGATFGVAISGIAGPGGATPDKPVGTVHFALDWDGGARHVSLVFPFDRQRVKVVSAHTALHLVLRQLERTS